MMAMLLALVVGYTLGDRGCWILALLTRQNIFTISALWCGCGDAFGTWRNVWNGRCWICQADEDDKLGPLSDEADGRRQDV